MSFEEMCQMMGTDPSVVREMQQKEQELRFRMEELLQLRKNQVTNMFQRGIITTAEFQAKMTEILLEIPVYKNRPHVCIRARS